MMHPRLWKALFGMTVLYQLVMAGKYGCLFDKRLCSREQFCSDDRLFGQCWSSKHEQVQYQVSVSVLRRLQEVLKQLMMQGFSWQDDITQHIIAKELSRIPHIRAQSSQPAQFKQATPKKAFSSAMSEPSVAQNYLDYMILDPRQSSSLRMQALPLDRYAYLQDDMAHSLHPHTGVGYPRPSSRTGSRQRDRDRQLLEDAISLYLSSAPPSFHHRGAAGLPTAPYYEDLDFPLDYGEDYTLQERPSSRQRTNKKVPQDYTSLSGLDDDTVVQLATLLERFGADPQDLSPQQFNRFAILLQLLQAEDTERTDPGTVTVKELTVEGSDTVSQKGAEPLSPAAALPSTIEPTLTPTPTLSTAVPVTVARGAGPTPQVPVVPVEDVELKEKTSSDLKTGAKDRSSVREEYGYIVTNQSSLSLYDGVKLLETLADRIRLTTSSFINFSVVGPALTFRIRQNSLNLNAEDVASQAVAEKNFLEGETGLKIIQTGVGERSEGRGIPQATRIGDGSRGLVLTMVAMACVSVVVLVALAITCLRHHARQLASGKLGLGPEAGTETHFDYQELCRQHMAAKSSFSRAEPGGRRGTDTSRVSSVSSQFSDGPQHSPSSHSSTPSWSEEPAQSNMDISTGHMILAYMEDHLKNKDRLLKEWEALCSYQAEPSSVSTAQSERNLEKNRHPDFVPYDHSRLKLKPETNPAREDYINASIIIDHDPRLPAYIATQGPLSHTTADFWQMVWENGCTVIVMMTALVEDGEQQCERYWPDEGSSLYNIYEVNLVSEHIWCKDFLVRSFYLKNVQTQETRTLTQFHLLGWPAQGIPTSTRPLLDFRRKVNKCYRGRSCPIIVHCSDGTGRTGTYILIDMVLNRMAKGVKEIDIAATLEHIRDQRPNMVRTKDQFEFALTAVAEEVNAILKALPQ
ncbi:protein tyrosine phosphatase receptor type Na [Electrophorus electricus]|uniref:protein tyrosine phosphatase receptor type Na n=1 Tax=Electrophorus electricus TaxID=8005 RepID=UPI0015CFF9A6|nr:protein tyrosine phosphatase receptor type Na [Electrophorus electricus]